MDLNHSVGNIFDSIPDAFENEIVDCLVQSKQLKIERIVSKGHTSPASGWYNQQLDEWVIVIQGEAVIAFDNGSEVMLKAGDHLSIPAFTKHRVKWTDPMQDTVWIAVHH